GSLLVIPSVFAAQPSRPGARAASSIASLKTAAAIPAPLQTSTSCTSSPDAAVSCFVANAVAAHMTSPRYGMTTAQFEAYGIAVSHILATNHTYLMLLGLASAVADAMPPANANGTANQAAQDVAAAQIVNAAIANGLINVGGVVTAQDAQWFVLDIVGAMNVNNGYMSLLTPGISMRLIDTALLTATTGSGTSASVNWSQADSTISTGFQSFVTSGLVKIPSGLTSSMMISFLESAAQAIVTYKNSTGRAKL
ncbi:MAG: hypothetical protein ACRD41_04990, partial [Candidatus Acidiferrales bacterium]